MQSLLRWMQPGAFDETVKGVDAIAHTASPFHFNADDPNGELKSHYLS